jgi:hypothetical protein
VGEVVEFGDLGSPERVAVVDLEIPAHVAPGDDALRTAYGEGAAKVSGDRPAGVGHADHVDTPLKPTSTASLEASTAGPARTLGFMQPSERLSELLAHTG